MKYPEIDKLVDTLICGSQAEMLKAAQTIRVFAKSPCGQAKAGDFSKIVQSLCRALESQHPAIAPIAAEALGEFGEAAKEAVGWLNKALESDCPELRWCAAEALGKIAPASECAVCSLARALSDENRTVRIAAAWSLKKIGAYAQSAVPELIEAANSGDPMLQRRAIRAMGRIGGAAKAALPMLRALLRDAEDAFGRDGELLRHVLEIAISDLDDSGD